VSAESDEYEIEPIPGLPEDLPEGETLLWQGAPSWVSVARRVYHAHWVAIYFAVLLAWRASSSYAAGDSMAAFAVQSIPLAIVATLALGLLGLLSWLTQRTTIYSITSRRLVMRYGIAMPIRMNIPFAQIGSADLNTHADGTGDIALVTSGASHLAYLHLWPHVRPWYVTKTQPMMRSLANPSGVANILSKALSDAHPDADRTHVLNSGPASSAVQGSATAALGAT
jgi:Bacterial PH domain